MRVQKTLSYHLGQYYPGCAEEGASPGDTEELTRGHGEYQTESAGPWSSGELCRSKGLRVGLAEIFSEGEASRGSVVCWHHRGWHFSLSELPWVT